MHNVIDFTSKVVNLNKIYWDITVDEADGAEERYRITRNKANNQIIVHIVTYSFDRIFPMRKKALEQARKEFFKGAI